MTHAQCPTCGGPIEFKVGSSFLVVCPHCKSAIARTDRELKDLGKVAALADTESPLRVGLSGKYFSHPFTITGRAQLKRRHKPQESGTSGTPRSPMAAGAGSPKRRAAS